MHSAYFSGALDCPVGEVWSLVRNFNDYPRYIDGVTESVIEDDKRGDEVGAVRRFRYGGAWIRQRLVAHSDADRSFTYAGLDRFPFPATDGIDPPAPIDYEGTLRLMPIVDGDRTFVEWFLTFEAPMDEAAQWTELLVELIAQWVDSLRHALAGVRSPELSSPA